MPYYLDDLGIYSRQNKIRDEESDDLKQSQRNLFDKM